MLGLGSSSEWIKRHPVRVVVYATILATFTSVLFKFSCKDGVSLSWIINQPSIQNKQKSIGLSCSVSGLGAGWLRGGIHPWLELAGLSFSLQEEQPAIQIHVENGAICWNREIIIDGIRIGTSKFPGLIKLDSKEE